MRLRLFALIAALAVPFGAPAHANGDGPLVHKDPGYRTVDKAPAYGRRGPACEPRRIEVPATYQTVVQKVLVSPGSCELREAPPVYGFVRQPVAVESERWSRTYRPGKAVPGAHRRHGKGFHKGKRHAYVEMAARPAVIHEKRRPSAVAYRSRRVMLAPPSAHEVCAPPVYSYVERKIVATPSHWDWRLPQGC